VICVTGKRYGATTGAETATGPLKSPQGNSPAAEDFAKYSEQQVPRGLKPARDDKNKALIMAYLKARPFEDSPVKMVQ
jgi:hypothetical protein